ncbi:MAG: bifunctional 3-deoxy-7-phosphoheptulonate synthase/chorismate mutase type II [Bacteroidales bacterium]|jgi:chorismate mutase|nr:bifunctional 3-deoxy-7-phosphoheptulonate synthase/chorismate mutase type II [Bacteroidales bacterium]
MNLVQGYFHSMKRPLIIAGPCSAESEMQVLNTATALTELDAVKIFRAGIWKPRTKPGQFEGAGDKGLKWLQKVKQETGLLIATEVATANHAKKAIDAGIDVLWIGARTTGSPIYVQEIAEAVKGQDVKVMIKNPLHPDIDLWCGAIQRFYDAGVRDLAAVHRGFYPFEKSAFRNLPLWEIPIELQLRHKDLPIICDPSHIAGKTNHIETISQHAMDLNMAGLMIEVHENPKVALTDRSQQMFPSELNTLLKQLSIRDNQFIDHAYLSRIEQLRKEIDHIDYQLIDLLSQRQDIIKGIAKCKSEMNVNILQLQRWESILQTRLDYAETNNLSRSYVLKLLQSIHKEAIRLQSEIMRIKPSSTQDDG